MIRTYELRIKTRSLPTDITVFEEDEWEQACAAYLAAQERSRSFTESVELWQVKQNKIQVKG